MLAQTNTDNALETSSVQQPSSHLSGALLGSAGFLLTYPLVKLASLPTVYYLPTQGVFSTVKPEGMIAQGYYGSLLWSVCAFILFYLLGRFALSRPLAHPKVQRGLMWAMIVLFVDAAVYFTYVELASWGFK